MIRWIKKKLRRNKIVRQQTSNDLYGEEHRKNKQAEKEQTVQGMNSLKEKVAIARKDVEIQQLMDQLYLKDVEIQRLKKIIDSDEKAEIQRLNKIIQSANDAYNDLRNAFAAAENAFTSPKEMPIVEKKFGEEDIIGPSASY